MAKLIKFGVRRLCLIFGILFLTVGCDQVTKVVARDTLKVVGPLRYLGDTVILTHAENPGAFLSLGAALSAGVRFWIFTVVVGVTILAAGYFLLRARALDKWTTVAVTLFVAGGIGNMIDRVGHGTVTDFINLGIGQFRTGIFNVADMAIVLGVVMIAWVQLRPAPVRD